MTSDPLRVHRCTLIVESIKDAAAVTEDSNDIGLLLGAVAAAVQNLAEIVAEIPG